MVEFQEYSSAWLVYFAAVAGLLIVTWRLFRGISWAYPRKLIFITVAVLLLTPVLDSANYWAPAWIVASLEFLFSSDLEKVMPILRIMLIIWCVAAISLTFIMLIFFRGKKNVSSSKGSAVQKDKKIPGRDNHRRVTPEIT
jgi:beta-lactamase regulating signal transducer with metallopeptidase domain